MSTVNTSGSVNFICADESRLLFYYIASRPCLITKNNVPDIKFDVFRFSSKKNDQPDKYIAQLQLQTKLSCSEQSARLAADASPYIPNDAQLLPLQVISSTATLGLPSLIQQTTHPTALANPYNCVLQAGFDNTTQIEQLTSLLRMPDSNPLSVFYKITYLQTLPPAQFELVANWDDVYKYLKTNVGFNALIFSVDIEQVSKQLIQNKTVQIKTRNTNPESFLTEAGRELANVLLTEFFAPAQPPIRDESSPKIGFYLQKVSIESIEKRSLTAQLNEISVVQRSIFPQALFAELIGQSHYNANKIIHQTNVNDSFFVNRIVDASLIAQNLDSNISLVQLEMSYGDNHESFVFTPSDITTKRFQVPSIINPKTGKMLWPVSYCFTVHFEKAVGGAFSVSSKEMTTELNQVYLDVGSLYTNHSFHINSIPGFNWNWYSNVVVTVGYTPLNELRTIQSRAFQLTPTEDSAEYDVQIPDPSQYLFTVSKDYTMIENSPHISSTIEAPSNQNIIVGSPLYPQRTILVNVSMEWVQVLQVLVIARYHYDTAQPELALQQRLLFTPQDTKPQTFSADQPDTSLRTVELAVFVTNKQGNTEHYTLSTEQDHVVLTHQK